MFRSKILTAALLLVLGISAVATAQRATAPRNRDRNQQAQTQTAGRGGETFTDTRDGKTYRTVTIGGVTWMAENLNFHPGSDENGPWCYDNNESNCQRYGLLYDWRTALNACPAGWQLPTNNEWDALVRATGDEMNAAIKLRSRTGWTDDGGEGTDDFGFGLLPGGYYGRGNFFDVGVMGAWWTSTSGAQGMARYRSTGFGGTTLNSTELGNDYGMSVRCVKGGEAQG